MPTIKLKKATADYIAEKEREKEKEKDSKTKEKSKPSERTFKTKLKKLDGEVLFEKRKRALPVAEQTLHDWIDGHLESKSGIRLCLPRVYEFYGTSCLEDNKPVLDIEDFSKSLKDKFGKEFAFKVTSPLKGLIKEIKIAAIKKVKHEAGKKRMIEIIQEVLIGLGNPKAGVRFQRLLSTVAEKHPGLSIGLRPNALLRHIDNDFYQKKVALVKGVGKCGYYRVPGVEETIVGDDEKENEDGKAVENGEAEGETVSKRGRKKKIKPDGTEEETGEKTEGEETDDKDGEKKKKKKKSGVFVCKPIDPSDIDHINPRHVEDTFPLAITYSSEPKSSTFARMKKYVERYYPEVDIERSLRPALEKGLKLGIWEQVNSNYLLNIEEFDPNLKDSVDDVICAAIIATTEPKIASVRAIKQYVQDYHADFNIDSHPNKFKYALEKGVQKAIIKQVSGLGATGSYQLMFHFTPSPGLLAGDEDKAEVETILANDNYEENYVVRPTKSGRNKSPTPKKTTDVIKTEKKLEKKVAAGIVKKVKKEPKGKKRGRKPIKDNDDDDDDDDEVKEEEEEEEEEELPKKPTPAKKAKKSPKKTPTKSPAKTKGRRSKTAEAENDVKETRPLKKRSRNTPKKRDRGMAEKSSRTSRGKSLSSYKEVVESDVDESDAEREEPVKKRSKSRR